LFAKNVSRSEPVNVDDTLRDSGHTYAVYAAHDVVENDIGTSHPDTYDDHKVGDKIDHPVPKISAAYTNSAVVDTIHATIAVMSNCFFMRQNLIKY
jgi:hypothetical protein